MPSIYQAEYKNSITFILDYKIEKEEFTSWKERLIDQAVKSVEVPGFRKGKAPRDIALSKIKNETLDDLIFRETLEKYGSGAITEVTEEIKKDERILISLEVNADPEYTGEKEGEFFIRLVARLLPEIEINSIDNLTIPEFTPNDLSGRPTLEEFVKVETQRFIRTYNSFNEVEREAKTGDLVVCNLSGKVDGNEVSKLASQGVEMLLGSGEFLPDFEKQLPGIKKNEIKTISVSFPDTYFEKTVAGKKALFDVECLAVKEPVYSSIDEIFVHNKEASSQFKTRNDFDTFLKRFYTDETEKLIEEKKQRHIIQKVVEVIPDFDLPEERVSQETSRIFLNLQQESEKKGLNLVEVFIASGIPYDTLPNSVDEIRIKDLVEQYVKKEFKLSSILHYIYEKLVESKISKKRIDQAVEEIKKNPGQFNISADSSENQIRDFATDRLKRQSGAQFLFDKFLLTKSTNRTDTQIKSEGGQETEKVERKKVEKKNKSTRKK